MNGLVYDSGLLAMRTGAVLETGLKRTLEEAHSEYSSEAHILTRDMLEKSFAWAQLRRDRVVGRFGTDSGHGAYEEEGHIVHAKSGDYWWEGHHQYRDALDESLIRLGSQLRDAFREEFR